MEGGPEMLVATTYSGSMTQEVFYLFAEHFIKSLPKDHGPVILLLDDHGSRWSVQALKLLWDNVVYCFFIASHTSIWAQPNDAGTNKRLHWAVEQVARNFRQQGAEPNVAYFNRLLCLAWELFLKTENDDLEEDRHSSDYSTRRSCCRNRKCLLSPSRFFHFIL
jgi:hypothetical protein